MILAKAVGVHHVNAIRNAYRRCVPSLRMFRQYGPDFAENAVLLSRRQRGYVAYAPYAFDDVFMGAVMHVEECCFNPRRPVAVAWGD